MQENSIISRKDKYNLDKKTLDEKIARINELYHRSKQEGLTPDEKIEQEELRKEYIANIRANLRGQLNNISIREEDGTITDLGAEYGNKN